MENVLFVIDTLQTGGAEKSILEITSRFTQYRPIICTLFSKKSDLKPVFEERGIRVIELNLGGKLWLVQGIKRFRKMIDEVRPAIVHSSLFKSELLARLAMGRSPIHIGSFVNDSYATVRYQQQGFVENVKLNLYRFVDSFTARNVSCFTSLTEAIAATNSAALGINRNKIKTIYRGRSIEGFEVYHPPLEQKPFVFQAVARLLKRKGYVDLVKAVQILSQKRQDFVVRIAGEGHDRKGIEDIINQNKLEQYFEFLGNRKDVPQLLRDAHCFVFASHYEGQGGALIEAMLSAKPIVATRIDVFEEQITDYESGRLFTLLNAPDLADKMLWVMENYAHATRMGIKARSIAVERFDINSIAQQHEELYSKLIARLHENTPVNSEATA